MRDRIVCDECEENITHWPNIYKNTYYVRERTSPISSQEHDFCSMTYLVKYYEGRKYREVK